MKISSRTLLAAALLTALPMGSALACTIGAWQGTNTATNANAKGPSPGTPAFARYSGACSLEATSAGTFVTDNSPGTEGAGTPYRARFYVLTPATGTAVVFGAYASDAAGASGGATPVVSVEFTGSAFRFAGSGVTGTPQITGVVANRWYSVELSYQQSLANGLTATVQGNGAAALPALSNATGAGTVGSASLGLISGTATRVVLDAFVSTRATTPIGRLCPGDANNSWVTSSGVTGRTVADAVIIRNEVAINGTSAVAIGQPDVNESGGVTVGDAAIVRNLVATAQGACP